MPRHRIEAPRQRTLWPAAGQSARRVLFRAAGRREAPSHAKPTVAPEWRRRLARSQRRMLQHAGRRMVVSPWFAAGAGVVIATGVVIYMPHAKLNPAISIHHCKQADCTSQQLTPQLVPPAPAGTGAPVLALPSMTVWYQPVGHSTQSSFGMWIAIRAQQRTDRWQIRLVIPGATKIYVYGALSHPYGTDGVTVSNYNAGTESAGYAQIAGQESGAAVESSRNGYILLFQVRGSGTFGSPTQCSYNHVQCQFRLSNDLAPTTWSGSG